MIKNHISSTSAPLPPLSYGKTLVKRQRKTGSLDIKAAADPSRRLTRSPARNELKAPGANRTLRGTPPTRPTLTRKNASRDLPTKSGWVKTLANALVKRFAPTPPLLEDVMASLNVYNGRVSQHDEVPAPITRLLDRIDEREGFLGGTEMIFDSRAAGGDARSIDEIRRQVANELKNLDTVRGLVEAAQKQGIAVDLPLQQLMGLVQDGLCGEAILMGMACGMSAVEIRRISDRYIELGIPFNAHTAPSALFCDANVLDKQRLGSGAMNTVWLTRYRDPQTGVVHPMVFKPELDAPIEEFVYRRDGIGCHPSPKKNGTLVFDGQGQNKRPNLAGRAVAAYQVDKLLGLNFVPPTFMAMDDEGGIGTVMELAPGRSPMAMDRVRVSLDSGLAGWLREQPDTVLQEYATAQGYTSASLGDDDVLALNRLGDNPRSRSILVETDFDDPLVRRQLTDLQFEDFLTGQLDRNAGNYFVDDQKKLHAIDNDLSFGAATTQGRGNCPSLPRVISFELRETLLHLGDDALHEAVSHYVEKDEVEAMIKRLHLIQAELNKTGDDAVLVAHSSDDWLSIEVNNRLGVVNPGDRELTQAEVFDLPKIGYLARDRADWVDTGWQNKNSTDPLKRAPIFNPDKVRADLDQLRRDITAGS